MPIYEYKCDVCGECLEVICKAGDQKPQVCPKCGAAMRKVLSSPAIHFKGSGWYITDYAKKAGPAKPEKTAATTDKKEPAKKTDAAPTK